MEIDIDAIVAKDALVRKLDTVMDYDWLTERLKPYFPELRDVTDAPFQALRLVLLEHLQPYALRYTGKPFLASIYDNWEIDMSYMWFLKALPADIPPFEDIFNPVYDTLPQETLQDLLRHILAGCVSHGVAMEYQDEPLYYMNRLSKEEQTAEVGRLAQAYAEQFYQEIAAYREGKG